MELNTDAVIRKLTARMTPPPTDPRTYARNRPTPLPVPVIRRDPAENWRAEPQRRERAALEEREEDLLGARSCGLVEPFLRLGGTSPTTAALKGPEAVRAERRIKIKKASSIGFGMV
jgi:hypothetical protein